MDIEKYAKINATVLITGKTGTGKSWMAKEIFKKSPQRYNKFVRVDLASIQEDLLCSELFGHIKGAFTNAMTNKIGYCEFVGNGILFLDEVGELSLDGQKKLLTLIEEREFISVGSCVVKKFKGRILAATNKNLKKMVYEGRFREDLLFRMNIFHVKLQSLTGKPKMLITLKNKFFSADCERLGKWDLVISKELENFFHNYEWPGNIRELKNCIEYLVTFGTKSLELSDLPDWILYEEKTSCEKTMLKESSLSRLKNMSFKEALVSFEDEYFNYILNLYDGKINHTCRTINISKTTLFSKIKKLKIDLDRIKFKNKLLKENELKFVS